MSQKKAVKETEQEREFKLRILFITLHFHRSFSLNDFVHHIKQVTILTFSLASAKIFIYLSFFDGGFR